MSTGQRKINGQVVETFGSGGSEGIVNVRGTDHRNKNLHYSKNTGMVTGKQGASRMAGDKMQAFQAKLDAERAAGNKETARAMRDKKQARLQQERENRFNRRNPQVVRQDGSNGTNQYGDPFGTVYLGGSPTFNESTGEYNSYTGADGTVTNR